jgi:hypothetical protein
MRLQYFPWLFDDKNAWEKSFADPRYNYELPVDYFMSIYQVERKADSSSTGEFVPPAISMPAMPLPAAFAPAAATQVFTAATPFPTSVPVAAKEEAKHEDGILSQDEIDALLSGL